MTTYTRMVKQCLINYKKDRNNKKEKYKIIEAPETSDIIINVCNQLKGKYSKFSYLDWGNSSGENTASPFKNQGNFFLIGMEAVDEFIEAYASGENHYHVERDTEFKGFISPIIQKKILNTVKTYGRRKIDEHEKPVLKCIRETEADFRKRMGKKPSESELFTEFQKTEIFQEIDKVIQAIIGERDIEVTNGEILNQSFLNRLILMIKDIQFIRKLNEGKMVIDTSLYDTAMECMWKDWLYNDYAEQSMQNLSDAILNKVRARQRAARKKKEEELDVRVLYETVIKEQGLSKDEIIELRRFDNMYDTISLDKSVNDEDDNESVLQDFIASSDNIEEQVLAKEDITVEEFKEIFIEQFSFEYPLYEEAFKECVTLVFENVLDERPWKTTVRQIPELTDINRYFFELTLEQKRQIHAILYGIDDNDDDQRIEEDIEDFLQDCLKSVH